MKSICMEYFKYIIEHKKNVFKICWSKGMYIHAFTHDLSKFSIHEFIQYAKWFNHKNGINYDINREYTDVNSTIDLIEHHSFKSDFDKAWQHHKDKNKHHWNYWSERDSEMPIKYIKQMICDWEAMSIKFGDTAQSFYLNNYKNIKLKYRTRINVEWELGINDSIINNYEDTLEL